MDAITLDQFAVFVAIVEEGSFAAAARKLGRAQSAITYAIQKLENQSGVTLFDRSNYRAKLSEEGRALFPRIQRVMNGYNDFRVQAMSMTQGNEAELNLVVGNLLPLSMFTEALIAFKDAFPMVHLRVNSVPVQDVSERLLKDQAKLGLTFNHPGFGAVLDSRVVTETDLIVVVAAGHALTKEKGPISPEILKDHLQIVVSNPNADRSGPSFGIIGINQWRVNEAQLKHSLILAGIGWGSMPFPMVESDIAEGKLVALTPQEWDGMNRMPRLTCIVATKRDAVLGPGARFLWEKLAK